MTDITEYGDIMLNAIIDEWGRRRIGGLLEDGTKIIVVAVGATYEISVDAVCHSLATLQTQATYNISKDAAIASQSLTAQESTFNINQDAVIQTLAEVLVELIHVGIYEIYIDAAVQASATINTASTLSLVKDAITQATATSLIQSEFGISPEATVRVLAEVTVLKLTEVKVTRLFLIFGDLAIQIQGI